MWALSHSGAARGCYCGYSPHPLSVHACACHAGSVSLDSQGLDMEVTNTRPWAGAHVAQINSESRGSTGASVDGRRFVLL